MIKIKKTSLNILYLKKWIYNENIGVDNYEYAWI